MGLQENKRREQKEKEVVKKIFLFLSVAFIGGIVFNEIQDRYYESKFALLRFGKSKIEDFLIVGKNKDRFIIRGTVLTDEGPKIDIQNFVLSYIKSTGDILNINSKKASFFKKTEILTLQDDVDFISKSFIIKTQKVDILLKEKIAKNQEEVLIKSNSFTTRGENLLIDLSKEEIHLQKVKSIIRGI